MELPLIFSVVPPHASAYGLEAGKSTCSLAVADAVGGTVIARGDTYGHTHRRRRLQCAVVGLQRCAVQLDSGPPQLMEITDGLFTVSMTA